MKIGLVGYQGGGKSSVFELLTGVKPDPSKSHTGQLAVAVLPDSRFDGLVKLFNPKKVTPAKIELFDTPGLSRSDPEENASKLGVLRESDALVQVVGVFDGADAVKESAAFRDDMILADLQVVTNRIERVTAGIGKARPDREQLKLELAALEPIFEQLNQGRMLHDLKFTDDQVKFTQSFSLLTRKDRLIILNTAESDFDQNVVNRIEGEGLKVVHGPVGLELELQALPEDERSVFASEMGLKESCKDQIIETIFKVTDQILFFTSDEKEVRAWLLKRGSSAVEAAGTIHTDLARGFIRAEVMAADDLLRLESEREVKAANLHHVVGKDYVVKDGDEIVIRFSV